MKKFTILVDMDDTLVNTVEVWVEWLNTKYNLDVKYDDLKVWDMQAAFPSLTLNQIRQPLSNLQFWNLVEAKEGAVEYLKKLMDDGHKVMVCSASHPTTIVGKVYNCLLQHFPYLDTTQLIFAYDKQLINADFLIDDGIHNLIDAPYRGILITTPYNKLIKETDYEEDMVRVNNFKEAYDFIEEQANESS